MSIFEGSAVALVTPFTQDGVNFKELEKLLDFHLKNSTDAIVACGTTGEPSTMTKEEKRSVIKFCVDYVAGRIPVIAGTGDNNTATSIESSKYAESIGADALLMVTPYYNKCSQSGLVKHFFAVAGCRKHPDHRIQRPCPHGAERAAPPHFWRYPSTRTYARLKRPAAIFPRS